MADKIADLEQQVLQRTLKEVADEDVAGTDPCVICLDTVTEPSIAVPCKHTNFDYLCLLSWVEQQATCPLCKTQLTAVQYDLQSPQGPKTYHIPPPVQTEKASPGSGQGHSIYNNQFIGLTGTHRRRRRAHSPQRPPPSNNPLAVRRNVYRNQLYSLRVGSNRLSRYSEVAPENFNLDEELVSRARKWIRRELQVFSFLNPETEAEAEREHDRVSRPGHRRLEERRANNAEFLLEYVIAILRTVDIKGSAGQAEELLRDFVGRENARLFLHELLAWLRSPYMSLEDWDRNVQYPSPTQRYPVGNGEDNARGDRRSSASPTRRRRRRRSASPVRGHSRSLFDRVSRPGEPRPLSQHRRRFQPRRSNPRPWTDRSLHMLDRYIPD
ncbi:hypothetical protein N7462_001892 [Penicillium macrosclerotiorum]|uniref:uncharacterized protein n=1 Tax=Penicillium macrosclerotiorum TaxID=303699 RepID=UPI0025469597|nr:uncharacterized protein N7462_001892 [Penicillium macrosclerotiorum]KAJ5692469.1 hypothetical protein N7462_001892 [Penicillium macrosclerotiorum]